LESRGYRVRRVFDLASREIVEPALEQGKVDVVPEYLGTSLSFVAAVDHPDDTGGDPLGRARQAFGGRGITVLDPARAQDQNGVVVSRTTADRLGLQKVSDLAPVAPRLSF